MTRKFLALFALLGATSATAGEYCELDGSEMFSCTFKHGAKAVEVCDAYWLDGDMASYGFFKRGSAVEKEIITDKASLIYNEGSGMGGLMSESVTFQAGGGYAYEVFWSAEQGDARISGGINVLKNGDEIANLSCDPGSVRHEFTAFFEMIDNAQVSP